MTQEQCEPAGLRSAHDQPRSAPVLAVFRIPPGSTGADSADFVVNCATMANVLRIIHEVAPSKLSVLLVGETGTGKRSLARTIHELHEGREHPFFVVNCAALPEHDERDPFREINEAGVATVLLDGITNLSPRWQAKLLSFVEAPTQKSPRSHLAHVRWISTARSPIALELSKSLFRPELYYRLAAVPLSVPPLRVRTAEIEPMAKLFLERARRLHDRTPPPSLTLSALAALTARAWPGNVRELRNTIERSVLLCRSGTIDSEQVWFDNLADENADIAPKAPEGAITDAAARERERIMRALAKCHGNQTEAAKLLRMARRTLVAKLASLDVPRPRKSFR